jgi:hypothetical protein
MEQHIRPSSSATVQEVGPSSMVQLALAAVPVLVVLCCNSSYGTCDALDVPCAASKPGGNVDAQLDAVVVGAPPALAFGETYRPPMVKARRRRTPAHVWTGVNKVSVHATLRRLCPRT